MSAPTLESLRADVEAKSLITKAARRRCVELCGALPCYDAGYLDARNALGEAIRAWEFASNVASIFQRHGPKAAMLYKLSDGAIDPRELEERL